MCWAESDCAAPLRQIMTTLRSMQWIRHVPPQKQRPTPMAILAPRWHITRPSKRKVCEVSSCSRPSFHTFAHDSWPSITCSRVRHNLDAQSPRDGQPRKSRNIWGVAAHHQQSNIRSHVLDGVRNPEHAESWRDDHSDEVRWTPQGRGSVLLDCTYPSDTSFKRRHRWIKSAE